MIKNHGALMDGLRSAFPTALVTEFVGAKHGMAESIALFGMADVVVAPHGAALGFLAFMRPNAACVEVEQGRAITLAAARHRLSHPWSNRCKARSPCPPSRIRSQVGYRDLKGMKFPAPYYMALALSVDVAYFLRCGAQGQGG